MEHWYIVEKMARLRQQELLECEKRHQFRQKIKKASNCINNKNLLTVRSAIKVNYSKRRITALLYRFGTILVVIGRRIQTLHTKER